MNQHGESEWVKLVKHAQVHGACAVHRFTEHARFRLSVLLLGLAVYVPVFCSMRSHMAWTWVSFHFSKAEPSVQSDLVLTVQYRLGLCTLISQPFCPSELLLSTCPNQESHEKGQGLSTKWVIVLIVD